MSDQRIELAGKLSVIANREFQSANRELLVSFNNEELQRAMLATIRLNYAQAIRDAEPSTDFYLTVQTQAFLNLWDRGAIAPIAEITPLGEQAIEAMRRRTGIGIEALPTREPVLTPQQQLETIVRQDFKSLPSKQFRQKINNDRAYRECFERLSPDLESTVTARVLISET